MNDTPSSKTPRTDAESFLHSHFDQEAALTTRFEVVPAALARTLETELAEARRLARDYEYQRNVSIDCCNEAFAERDTLRAQLTRAEGEKLVDFELFKSKRVIKIPVFNDAHGNEILTIYAHKLIEFEKMVDEVLQLRTQNDQEIKHFKCALEAIIKADQWEHLSSGNPIPQDGPCAKIAREALSQP